MYSRTLARAYSIRTRLFCLSDAPFIRRRNITLTFVWHSLSCSAQLSVGKQSRCSSEQGTHAPRFNRASAAEAADASGRVRTAGPRAGTECIRFVMAAGVSLLTRTWPPPPGAYDYVLTLNDEEIAWEGLRRNRGYQRHYRVNTTDHVKSHRLSTGQSIWRVASLPSGCERWGLHPFCRSGPDRAGGSHPLAHRSGNRHPPCGGEASPVDDPGRPGPR